MGDDSGARQPVATEKKVKVYQWYCGFCGQMFETNNYAKRYCNDAHKQAAYRERKKL